METFFNLISTTPSADGFTQAVRLNASHKVFEGHFPGQPVLPGVFSLAMIKKGIEGFLNQKLRYFKIRECKFLHAIDPRINEDITFVCVLKETTEGVGVTCTMNAGATPALKLKALLINE